MNHEIKSNMSLARSFGRKRFFAKLIKKRDSVVKSEFVLRSSFANTGEILNAERYLRANGWNEHQIAAIPRGAR
jgi:uncharacterized protein (DUF927 family)